MYVIYYSDYSTPVMYATAVAAPSQPDPPMLSEQFVSALTVSWIRRPGDDVFTLHMDDASKVRSGNYLLYLTFTFGMALSAEAIPERPNTHPDVTKGYEKLLEALANCIKELLEIYINITSSSSSSFNSSHKVTHTQMT